MFLCDSTLGVEFYDPARKEDWTMNEKGGVFSIAVALNNPDNAKFLDTAEAIQFVAEQAVKGSALHACALYLDRRSVNDVELIPEPFQHFFRKRCDP